MPRKAKSSTVTGKITPIVNYFRTASLEVADIVLELATDAVKERHAKGAKVVAGRASGSAAGGAVDAATASVGKAAAATAKPKGKPGPKKGFKKATAGAGTGATSASLPLDENVGTELPEQEPAIDLG